MPNENTVTSHLYDSQLYDSLGYAPNSVGPVHALWEIMLNFSQLYDCFSHLYDVLNGSGYDFTFLSQEFIHLYNL